MPILLTTQQQTILRKALAERLKLDEVKELCFDVDVDVQNLSGDNKAAKVLDLLVYYRGQKDFTPLIDWLKDNRKDICRDLASAIPPLDVTAPPPVPGPQFPIVTILAHNDYFTGRADLLTEIATALGSGGAAALHGLGGVGKSTLAAEFFYHHQADYDVAWWLRAEDPTVLRGDLALLATALALPEAAKPDQAEAVAAVMRWLDGHDRWLLVFDNAPNRDAVRPYIPPRPRGHILITSRDRVWAGVAKGVDVDTLPKDDARDFLLSRTGQTDAASAANLAEALGYLPLALEQAGAYMDEKGTPLPQYLKLYEARRLALLEQGRPAMEQRTTVGVTWTISFEEAGKTPGAADLMNLLAFLAPDDVPLAILRDGRDELPEGLAGVAADDLAFEDAVGALRHVSLLTRTDDNVRVHRLVQAVARDRLTEDERKTWAEAAAEVVDQAFPDVAYETWPLCAALLPHALAAADYAEALEVALESVSYLLHQAGVYLWGRAEYARAADLQHRALTLREATLGPEAPEVAISASVLGLILKAQGDLAGARALHERALRIDENALGPDHPTVATRLNNLGLVLRDQGDLAGARALFERALRIWEANLGPDHPNVASAANNLGMVLQDQGDLAGARTLFERALRIWEANLGPEHPNVASTLWNLGTVLQAQGDRDGARAAYERALRIFTARLGPGHPYTQGVQRWLAALGG